MTEGTVTTGVVAQRLGVGLRTVEDAVDRGIVAPTAPARKQGSPARWAEDDVRTLALAFAVRRALIALLGPAQRAAQKLRAMRPSVCVAVGPRGTVLSKRARSVEWAARRVGWPCVFLVGDIAGDPRR